MNARRDDAYWLLLWNIGVLVGLVGLPALIGFLVGQKLEAASKAPLVPWRLLFAALGVLVGGLAAWRTLMPASTRPRE